MKTGQKLAIVACELFFSAATAWAVPTIVVGQHDLLPNTPNQIVKINVSGGDEVDALDLNAQIADGGPEVGGSIDGPAITGADIITGTIFANNNDGQSDLGSYPQVALRSTVADSGSVIADGLLTTLTIDTTGFSTGTFSLNLGDTLNGPTDFDPISADITDGSITIVPEPASICLLLGGAGLMMQRRRRATCESHVCG